MLVFGRLAGGGATLLPRSPGENLHVPRQHGAGDRGKGAGVRARRADAELLEPPVGGGGLGAPLLPAAVLLRLLRRRGAAPRHELDSTGWSTERSAGKGLKLALSVLPPLHHPVLGTRKATVLPYYIRIGCNSPEELVKRP